MADPFLSINEFESEFTGNLSDGELLTAERLLQVVSDWIRDKVAPRVLDDDDPAARQVVFEVVRDAANYGGLERLSQFQNVTAHRTEAGTFDEALKVVNDYLTDRHKRLLGIPLRAAPRGHFVKCDY